MSKVKEKHEVRIVLRDWSKAKKVNRPVAETHNRNKKETKKNE